MLKRKVEELEEANTGLSQRLEAAMERNKRPKRKGVSYD